MEPIQFSRLDVEKPTLLERLLRKILTALDNIGIRLGKIEKVQANTPAIPFAAIKKELQSDGKAPLNLLNLPGLTFDAQIPYLISYTATPTGQTLQALKNGQMVLVTGSPNILYRVNGGNPNTLTAINAAGAAHNWLSATHTDTVAASPVLGDITYGNSTPAWTKLAGNTTTTKKFLTETGNGTISAAPVWTDLFGTSNTWGAEQIFSLLATIQSSHLSTLKFGFNEEEITLSTVGATTDSAANLLEGSSIILGVTGYVTQAISGGGVTTVALGTSSSSARFNTLGTLTAGAGIIGLNQWQGSVASDVAGPVQYSSAKVRLTADATPTQGKIRIVVFYAKFAASTN